jgi:hypothetical protein
MELPGVHWNALFEHETAEVAIGGDVVEAVVMHAGVGEMLRHVGDDVPLSHSEQILISRELEAEQGIAVLKTLGPLGPTARGIAAGDGDDGGTIAGFPSPVEAQGFIRGQLQRTLDSWGQILCLQGLIGLQPNSFGFEFSNECGKAVDDLLHHLVWIRIPDNAVEDFHFDGPVVAGFINSQPQHAIIDDPIAHHPPAQEQVR